MFKGICGHRFITWENGRFLYHIESKLNQNIKTNSEQRLLLLLASDILSSPPPPKRLVSFLALVSYQLDDGKIKSQSQENIKTPKKLFLPILCQLMNNQKWRKRTHALKPWRMMLSKDQWNGPMWNGCNICIYMKQLVGRDANGNLKRFWNIFLAL